MTQIATVTNRKSDAVPVDRPEIRITATQTSDDQPALRLWTRNGPYSATAVLDVSAYRELVSTLNKAAEEAWG